MQLFIHFPQQPPFLWYSSYFLKACIKPPVSLLEKVLWKQWEGFVYPTCLVKCVFIETIIIQSYCFHFISHSLLKEVGFRISHLSFHLCGFFNIISVWVSCQVRHIKWVSGRMHLKLFTAIILSWLIGRSSKVTSVWQMICSPWHGHGNSSKRFS